MLAELFGDFSVNTVFDLSATQYVLLDGLYLNTHATCIIHISPSVAPCSSSAPFSSYANEGIRRDPTTSNITLTDVLISGMEDSCLIGPMDGVETFNDVECAYNGFTGDNYDDGTHSQSGGTVTRTNFTSIWNGCEQYYGSSYAIPISYCADDSSSGDGDGTAGGLWIREFVVLEPANSTLFYTNIAAGQQLLFTSNLTTHASSGDSWSQFHRVSSKIRIGRLVLSSCFAP